MYADISIILLVSGVKNADLWRNALIKTNKLTNLNGDKNEKTNYRRKLENE